MWEGQDRRRFGGVKNQELSSGYIKLQWQGEILTRRCIHKFRGEVRVRDIHFRIAKDGYSIQRRVIRVDRKKKRSGK